MSRVLVIDDSAAVRRTVRRILEFAGYQVLEAPDGRQGLRMQEHQPADLVVADIFMPEMDGIELLLELRITFPETPVVAMSGEKRMLDVARELGAPVIQKPFSAEELSDLIKRELETRNGGNGQDQAE